MRVVQLIAHYVPATRFGGPQRVAHGLGRSLVKRGHEVTVCCTNLADERDDLGVPTDVPIDVDGVTVYYQATALSRYWGDSRQLWRRAAILIRDADVVLVHFHYQFANWVGAKLARQVNCPYFVFAHGSFRTAAIRRRGTWKKQLYLATLERKNLQKADSLIFNAEEEKQQSLFANRGIVLRNGISPADLVLPCRGGFRRRHPEVAGKLLFLFLGRIDFHGKGLDMLLAAFGRIVNRRTDVHLVLAGPSERDGRALTVQRVADLSLENHVTFTGLLDGAEKLEALADADAFLLPSRSEGLSIALLEALYVGLPTLVTDQVGLHETVASLGAGVVVGAREEEIEEGLWQLCDDHQRERMKHAATETIAREFSWDVVAGELLEHIRQAGLLRRPSRRNS